MGANAIDRQPKQVMPTGAADTVDGVSAAPGAPRLPRCAKGVWAGSVLAFGLVSILAITVTARDSRRLIIPGLALAGVLGCLLAGRTGDRLEAVRSRRFLAGVVLGGVALRLLVVLALPLHLSDDFTVYHDTAKIMADQWIMSEPDGLRCFFPPGQVFSLGVLYRLFGPRVVAGQLLNVLYAAGTILAVWQIGRKLFDERTGRASAVLVALMPSQIFGCMLPGAEASGAAWMAGGLAVVVTAADRPKRWWPVLLAGGLCFGVGALIRPQLLLVGIMLGICALLLAPWTLRRRLATLALLGVAAFLPVAPWTYRNYRVTGGFILLSSNAGGNLWSGNNDTTDGHYTDWVWQYLFTHADNDLELNQIGAERAKEWIVSNPGKFCRLALRKFKIFWVNDHEIAWWAVARCGYGDRSPQGAWAMATSNGFYVFVLVACAAALIVQRPRLRSSWMWLILPTIFVGYTAIHMVFESQGKYRYVLAPLLCVLAGAGLSKLHQAVRTGWHRITRRPAHPGCPGRQGPAR